MKKEKSTPVLYITAAIGFCLFGLITLVPLPSAQESNLFGYLSLCPFAPVSTAICFFAAYTLNGIRIKKSAPRT